MRFDPEEFRHDAFHARFAADFQCLRRRNAPQHIRLDHRVRNQFFYASVKAVKVIALRSPVELAVGQHDNGRCEGIQPVAVVA